MQNLQLALALGRISGFFGEDAMTTRKLPPCDHDECPPTHCKRSLASSSCSACRWWQLDESDSYHDIVSPYDPVTYDQIDPTEEGGEAKIAEKFGHAVRRCRCPGITFYQRPARDGATVCDGSEYKADLITGPDFGCTLFEPNAPETESLTALLSRIEALRECLEEAVVITRGARIGTIGATRVHTPRINVKAVERWGKVLRDNAQVEAGRASGNENRGDEPASPPTTC